MSPQKHAAQIANAQKSHGATTEAGRARSSQNSIRHSLCSKKYYIAPEDRPEFDLYYNDLIAALAPEGALESVLAEKIILDEWRLTRARQLEDQIFCNGYMSSERPFAAGAETWLAHSQELATLTLYEQRINRVLTRNKIEFESKQLTRRGALLLDCDTSVPHPGEFSTMETHSVETPQAPAQPIEIPVAAAQEQPVGFVHSSEIDSQDSVLQSPVVPARQTETAPPEPLCFVHSNDAAASPTPDPLPSAPSATPSQAGVPEQPVGFVHSSAIDSPNSGPQPAALVAKQTETAAPHHPAGFVHSRAAVADPEAPPAATPQPASTPPVAARRAA
jgi:hypothetical protein